MNKHSKTISMAVAASAAIFMMVGCGSSGTTAGSRVEGANPSAQQDTPQAALVIPICTADAGSEPWTTDGTAAGSFMLKDINEGPKGSVPRKMGGNGHNNKFVVMGLDTYFPVRMQHTNDDNSTYETVALWKSDGTTAGTVMLKDFNNSNGLAQMVVMGGHLYFRGWDEEHGYQIWKTDGTAVGTVRVTDFEVFDDSHDRDEHNIGGLRALDNVVTFHASVENDGEWVLYATNGDWESGTHQLTTEEDGYNVNSMKVVNGKLYFSAESDTKGEEPYVSDGTKEGTKRIVDLNPGSSHAYPKKFTGYNGYVYFQAEANSSIGIELYRTDGTEAGTTLVKDIYVGSSGSDPENFRVWKNELYFSARSSSGKTIWKTDGTSEGTVPVFEQTWSSIKPILTLNDKLLFRANGMSRTYAGDYTLYAYDGSVGEDGNATDPVAVHTSETLGNFKAVKHTAYGDILLFMANDENNDTDRVTALYGTDGTEEGTVKLKGNLCPPYTMDGGEMHD